jgi:hypothetical protein
VRLTLSITLMTAMLLVGCHSPQNVAVTAARPDDIYDFTTNRSAMCRVHRVIMSPKVVDLDFGMKPVTDTMKARWELFPHADETYDTGYCIPLVETRGRVFVCDQCTEARATWMNAQNVHPKP